MTVQNLFSKPVERQVFEPRWYQVDAVKRAISFFNEPDNKMGNAIEVLPTGSGKSLVIALIIKALPGKTIVLQPSKEILEQNFDKLLSYGFEAGIYSASLGKKQVRKITFATIGSVINNKHLFAEFQHIIIDECHLVNSSGGMYKNFIDSLENVKVLGLTATPYRLASNSFGSELRFITRTRERIFKRLIYYIQNKELFAAGYLAKLKYFDIAGFDRGLLKLNSSGSAYTDGSVKALFNKMGFQERIRKVIRRLVDTGRKNILVFTQFVDEAKSLSEQIEDCAYVHGETSKVDRERLLKDFKSGKIKVMCNVGVLTVGFDFPALETVVIGRPTMSLALYYQMVGRGIRIHPQKENTYIVDLCGNIHLFGAVEDIYIEIDKKGKFVITNRGKQLTNVIFGYNKAKYIN